MSFINFGLKGIIKKLLFIAILEIGSYKCINLANPPAEHKGKTMKKRIRKERRGRVFYVLLLPYLAILLATLLISVALLSSIAYRYMKETEELRKEQLKQLAVEIDYSFQNAIDVGDSVVLDPKVQLTAREAPLIYDFEDLRTSLLQADTHERFAGIMLYLNNHDLSVTQGVRRPSEEYYTWYESLRDMPYNTFKKEILDAHHLRTFLPKTTLERKSGRSIPVVPYIQSVPIREDGRAPNAQVIIYIDARPIEDKIRTFTTDAFQYVYLVYPDGSIGVQSQNAPNLEKWERKTDNEWMLDGEMYRSSVTALGKNGLQLVALSEKDAFYADWNKSMRVTVLLVAIYVAVGILSAFLLARKNYRPIQEISALVEDEKIGDEYERIRSAIASGATDRKQMTAIIEQQEPMVRSAYLSRLLNGQAFSKKKEELYRTKLGFAANDVTYYVVLCEFNTKTDFFKVKETLPEENLRCALIITENIGTELFLQHFTTHFVEVGRYGGAFVLGSKNNSQAGWKEIRSCCDALVKFAYEECDLRMTLGGSTGHTCVGDLPQCQDEARHALNHGLLMKRNSYTAYNELRPEETEGHFYYPADINLQLSGMLRAGEYEKAKEQIESLYHINFNTRNLNLHAGRCFVYEVGATVDGVLLSLMENALANAKQDEIGELLRKLGENISFVEAKEITMNHVDKCEQLAAVRKINATEQLVEKIALFIDRSEAEAWLDLGTLADEFGVTPQYISHIFKKYKKENIKDYVSRRKLAHAKYYLQETDLTGERISKKIGYASEAGLIRLFKKYENTTPNAYRQLIGGGQ